MKKLIILNLVFMACYLMSSGQPNSRDILRNADFVLYRSDDNPDLTEGLIAFYPFDGNANDVSGNHHDGSMNGGTIIPGYCGDSWACEYSGQKETFKFAGAVIQNPVFTFGCRIKITDENADTFLTCNLAFMDVQMKIVNHRYQIEIDVSGRKIILSDRNGLCMIDPQNPKFDFLTIFFDGSQLNFKINDQNADSLKINKTLIQSIFPLTISKDVIFTLKGIVDEIRLYNRLLSDTELRFITFGTYRTSPSVTIDSITSISNRSAMVYCGVRFGSTGKDFYRFDLHHDTLPNYYDSFNKPSFSIWTDTSFVTSITNLKPSTIYYLYVDYSHNCGGGTGSFVSFTTLPRIEYDSVVDVEGNIYRTLQIGKHKWMLENLRTTRYNDGTPIPNITTDSEWTAQTAGAFCWYDNNEAKYKQDYGALYNYYTVMDNHHICPTNWHVPTQAEWTSIPNPYKWPSFHTINKISYDEKDLIFPNDSEVFGYIEYPAGMRLGLNDHLQSNGMFVGMDDISFLWKSNGDKYSMIYFHIIEITGWYPSVKDGFGIRCIQDDELTDTTSMIRNGTIAIGLPTNIKGPNEKSIEIYPIPASRILHFQNLTGKAFLSIFDLQGRKIMDQIIINNQADISDLSDGIYLVYISDEKNIVIKKLFARHD
jgi:uncharacterized protein (TIGR02145 family)